MTPEDLITLTSARTAQLMRMPGSGKPYWTVAEAGIACADLEPEVYAALLYSYAGADECYSLLHGKLLDFASDMRQAEEWPLTIRRDDGSQGEYLDELVGMSLIEEVQPKRFGGAEGSVVAPMYLAILGVKSKTWMQKLAGPYAAIRWRYITWLSIGRAHMKRRMRQESYLDSCASR